MRVETVLKARKIREGEGYELGEEPPDDPMVLPLWHAHRLAVLFAGVAGAGRAAAIHCGLDRRGGVEKDYDMCSGLGGYRMGGAAITEWGAVVRGRVGRVCGHPRGGTCVAKSLGGAR